eukprot:3573537-Amphidinium_carterae.1
MRRWKTHTGQFGHVASQWVSCVASWKEPLSMIVTTTTWQSWLTQYHPATSRVYRNTDNTVLTPLECLQRSMDGILNAKWSDESRRW